MFSLKKVILKISAKFAGLGPATLLKSGSGTGFSVNFVKFLKTPIL